MNSRANRRQNLTLSFARTIDHHHYGYTQLPCSISAGSLRFTMSLIARLIDGEGEGGLAARSRNVFRITLRFLSCRLPYTQPNHPNTMVGTGQPESNHLVPPEQATYCRLPRGIRRRPKQTGARQQDNQEYTEER